MKMIYFWEADWSSDSGMKLHMTGTVVAKTPAKAEKKVIERLEKDGQICSGILLTVSFDLKSVHILSQKTIK